jgi:Chitobiase/beta-hexosaminidase C-terminal domain
MATTTIPQLPTVQSVTGTEQFPAVQIAADGVVGPAVRVSLAQIATAAAAVGPSGPTGPVGPTGPGSGGPGTVNLTSNGTLVITGSGTTTIEAVLAPTLLGAANVLPGQYLFATLPNPASYPYVFASTLDQGGVFSNGSIWQLLYNPTTGALKVSTGTPLPAGATGTAYSQQLVATGNVGSVTWAQVSQYAVTGTENTFTTSSSGLLTSSDPTNVSVTAVVVQATDSTGAVSQKTLTIQVVSSLSPAATPTFSPGAGTYTGAQSVTISCATPGSTIYYTTNGSTPSTSSPVYSTPITVSITETVQAIATASGYTQSATGSATYTISAQAATPTFSPAGSIYSSAQSVTISCATPGSTIYYTTNGTTPTTASPVYTSPLTVSVTQTVQAIATASGYTQSAVGSATYTISTAINPMAINFSATGGQGSTYAEGMRHWKNALRESSGFFYSSGGEYGSPGVPLNASGWPTVGFQLNLWTTSNGSVPGWALGGYFNCGFSGSGAETVTANGNCTISNLAQGGGNTTFRLTVTSSSGGGFGIVVGNVTQAVTNQFYYLPEYNTLTGIDNPLSASSITTEAISHYENYSHIRFMNWSGTLRNTAVMTSTNRATPSNTQAGFYAQFNAPSASCTSASPAVFTTSAAFCVNGYVVYLNVQGTGAAAPGGFSFGTPYYVVNASGTTLQLSLTSGGAAINSTTTGSNFVLGNAMGEAVPVEWQAALCQACGCGMWLNIGPVFDATYTYVTAIANALYAQVPAGIPIYLEIGDELWNGGAPPWGESAWLEAVAVSGLTSPQYFATQLHTIAGIFRGVFGSRYGTDVRLMNAWQAGGNGLYERYNVFNYYNSQGWTIPAVAGAGGDLWGNSIAPYINLPGYGNGQFYGGTASLASTGIMTVTAASGPIVPGAVFTGTGFPSSCAVVSQLTGNAGGIGTYQMSVTGTAAASTAITLTSFSLTSTIAQIDAQLTSIAQLQPFYSYLEQITVMGLKYGLPMIPYEWGWQTNGENSGLTNGGAAILDSGMTAVMNTFAQATVNAGARSMNVYEGGIDSNNAVAGLVPVDQLGVTYPISTSNSPRFNSIVQSASVTPTRNVITTPGTVIPGANYLDVNWSPGVNPGFNQNGDGTISFSSPNYGVGGQTSYHVWSAIAQTTTLVVNYTNSGSSAALTQLEWGGEFQPFQILGGVATPTLVSIPTGTNNVTIGSINLPAGHSYVTLGNPNTRYPSLTCNSLTFGGASFNFYISTTGSDSNTGTFASPWSITAINTKQSTYAGQRLGILPGTYDVSTLMQAAGYQGAVLQINGGPNSSTPTYIGTCNSSGYYAPGTVTLDAYGSVGAYGGGNTTYVPYVLGQTVHGTGTGPQPANIGNWTVDGIIFWRFSNWALTLSGGEDTLPSQPANVNVMNCTFWGSQTAQNGTHPGPLMLYDYNNVLVHNCMFYNNINTAADETHQATITGEGFGGGSSGLTIEYCTFIQTPGIYIFQDNGAALNTTVQYCYFDMTTTADVLNVMALEGTSNSTTGKPGNSFHHNIVRGGGIYDNVG